MDITGEVWFGAEQDVTIFITILFIHSNRQLPLDRLAVMIFQDIVHNRGKCNKVYDPKCFENNIWC